MNINSCPAALTSPTITSMALTLSVIEIPEELRQTIFKCLGNQPNGLSDLNTTMAKLSRYQSYTSRFHDERYDHTGHVTLLTKAVIQSAKIDLDKADSLFNTLIAVINPTKMRNTCHTDKVIEAAHVLVSEFAKTNLQMAKYVIRLTTRFVNELFDSNGKPEAAVEIAIMHAKIDLDSDEAKNMIQKAINVINREASKEYNKMTPSYKPKALASIALKCAKFNVASANDIADTIEDDTLRIETLKKIKDIGDKVSDFVDSLMKQLNEGINITITMENSDDKASILKDLIVVSGKRSTSFHKIGCFGFVYKNAKK